MQLGEIPFLIDSIVALQELLETYISLVATTSWFADLITK
nr:MAG TPA: hypothetical protein [Caudoviricetes sp.]